MRSQFFYDDVYVRVSERIKNLLDNAADYMSSETIDSTRAVGDAIERVISSNFQETLGDWCNNFSNQFARRAMADLAFVDKDGFYHVIDVKTHRSDTKFNMPNLTSVDRLARFYEDDKNVFSLLMVRYTAQETKVVVEDVVFCPIEFLSWKCLTIGALGIGQIQIANSNKIIVEPHYSRRSWMIEMCDALMEFYPKEITKIQGRIDKFSAVKELWENKEDTWKP